MLLGAESLPSPEVLPWQRPLAIVLGVALAVEAVFIFVTRARPTGQIAPPEATVNTPASLVELGKVLFSTYLLPFEVTSILLLVAMIGAIVLVRKERKVYE
jgi:NADH-quinone oxidoreductase subunit J